MRFDRNRPAALLALVLPLALAAAACGDSPTDAHDDEEFPAEMRLTIGAQTITMSDNGTFTPNPVFVAPGTYQVSVEFLDDEGVIMELDGEEVRFEMASDNAGLLSYQASGSFTGTLTAAGAGATVLRPQLFHIEEGHPDFGPFPLTITVQ